MTDASWLPLLLLLMSDTLPWRLVFFVWFALTLTSGGSHAPPSTPV